MAVDGKRPSYTPPLRAHAEGRQVGAQEFAAWVIVQLDDMMRGAESLHDQQVLYDMRQRVGQEISRRYPEFDLEGAARDHLSPPMNPVLQTKETA